VLLLLIDLPDLLRQLRVADRMRRRPAIPPRVISSPAAAGIPLAYAVAVLKYRLYDIDRLISRTVSYAIVTGLLVGVYAGLVLLGTWVLPVHNSAAIAAATLVVAALFNPLRRLVQHVVDRRFNRSRYDAELMITAFATRLQDATDLDAVRADLAATVDRALESEHLSLWWGRMRRQARDMRGMILLGQPAPRADEAGSRAGVSYTTDAPENRRLVPAGEGQPRREWSRRAR
jgi:hypothetical protein